MKRYIRLLNIMLVLLMMTVNSQAAEVTYHILTLPMSSAVYHIKDAYDGKRMEAIKVVVNNATTVELPAHFKSPLATGFTYYAVSDIEKSANAETIFENAKNKAYLYEVKGDPTPIREHTPISGNTAEYYVVYTYNAANAIAKLDGSVRYNVGIKDKGFLAYNRGRNNRPAVVPKNKVDPEILASESFSHVDATGSGITTYWSSGDNKNTKSDVESQFHFMFQFEGLDPYNIIIRTAYAGNETYIEKNDGINPAQFVYKWYKEGSLFAVGNANCYIASDEHKRYNITYDAGTYPTNPTELEEGDARGYIARPGNYHGQTGTIWNTFALLNNSTNTGYVFMGTRTVDGAGASPTPTNNKYYYLKFDNNNLTINTLTATDATKNYSTEGIYPIRKVTFKVATPFYAADPSDDHIVSVADWVSQYTVENDPIETKYLPTALKRKYCDFTGKFYKDAACTRPITFFSEADYDEDEGYCVYLGYTVSASLPFKAVTPAATYTAATWSAATWYELTDEGSTQEDGKKLKYDSSDSHFKNNGGNGEYTKTSEFAFIGDPYELQVVYRNATSGATPYYIGASGTPDTGTALTTSTDATAGYQWEIPTDATDGSFLLRLFGGGGYWNWDTSDASNAVEFSAASSTRIKVLNLPKMNFTYKIVDKSGRVAVKASASQTIFAPLSLASIPSIIVSPYIADETVTFYSGFNNGTGADSGTSRTHLSDEITETPNTEVAIYVKYTTEKLDNKAIKLNENQEFNVVLNGQYIYYDTEDNSIKSNSTPTSADLKATHYLWKLRNRDPYAMLIDNIGARSDMGVSGEMESVTVYDDDSGETQNDRQRGAWVKLASEGLENAKSLDFTTNRNDAQRFIAKMSVQTGVYEVMVATGNDLDASTTYYTIGRPVENTIKIYDQEHYQHGNDVLKFRLEQTIGYNYHLIDKSKHELLVLTSQSPDLALPAEFQSPLVETYHYYDEANMNKSGDEYTVKDSPTELTSIYSLDATYTEPTSSTSEDYEGADESHRHEAISTDNIRDLAKRLASEGNHYFKVAEDYYVVNVTKPFYNHIYVTYDTNDLVGFNNSGRMDDHPYLLRFLNPLADGYYLEDGDDKLTTSKFQAIYPYCNGDGNLNIYGQLMRDEQMGGGSSTRPRWVWFFESVNNDPYHVNIRSRSTIAHNGISHPTYLQTYAVHFNQDDDPDVSHIVTGGVLAGIASIAPTEYMILGSEGRYKLLTTAQIEGERRMVTSLEQYWKTYNMAKLQVSQLSNSTDDFNDTWTVPTEYRAALEEKGWHSYDAYANATRWNGYNDKSDGHEKKVVEKLEHWFQTFSMGDGSFALETADIPPVLVLLDLHGWEIMRKPLPKATTYPLGEDQLAALRAYDSPLVKEYHFFNNATKASGCHKYTLRTNDSGLRDEIKVNGTPYTSTSLADLPPLTASGVVSSGIINDQYVTYTVKEEYEKSFTYSLTLDEENSTYTESGTSSKFMILQNSRFARYNGNGNGSKPNYLSKPISEASNPSGGNVYDAILSPSQETVENVFTNIDTDQNGIIDDINLWYIQPNLNIDKEMGIKWGTSNNIDDAEPLSEFATKKKYKDKTGFDPYNIQLKNAGNGEYMTAHITTTSIENGAMVGDYTGEGGSTNVTLAPEFNFAGIDPNTETGSEGYDHTNIKMTNQTFMAVSDANGNMQLMPRFDHSKRVNLTNQRDNSLITLQNPKNHATASVENNTSMGEQTVFFVRPQVIEYHIIDNFGNEALRYKRAGEYYPNITEHFRSPLAKDFVFYSGLAETDEPQTSEEGEWASASDGFKKTVTRETQLTNLIKLLPTSGTYYYRIGTGGAITYKKVTVTKGLSDNIITGPFAEAGVKADLCNVYVRYSYDAEADHDADKILEGKWFTMSLAGKDVQSDGTVNTADGTGVSLYADDTVTPTKPATIDANANKWQWKFLAAPMGPSSEYYTPVDPYAIQLFNRVANYASTLDEPSPMSVGIKVNGKDRFALLSHPDGGYALAVDGLETYNYQFLNGTNMTTPSSTVAATTDAEISFTAKTNVLSRGAQLLVNDDVEHNYTYKVINNAGIHAVSGSQTKAEAAVHNYTPYLPSDAQTPLLNADTDYQYYGNVTESEGTFTPVPATKLITLYGLYDDVVYVHYNAYDPKTTPYLVPNKRNAIGSTITRHEESNNVAMNISGELPYNIIWENDNMMSTETDETTTITDGGSMSLSGEKKYVWYFEGNDPYGLKIKHKESSNYVNGTSTLTADASNAMQFMLLKKSGYDYGILQETAGTNRLSGYGQTTVTGDPTKFIIFGLSVHDLIYHLIIAKTCPDKEKPQSGEYVDIPYMETLSGTPTTKRIYGTTQRDLTTMTNGVEGDAYQVGKTLEYGGNHVTYCNDAGVVSLGDVLEVPTVFYRPNCTFEHYIEGVYSTDGTTAETELNSKYKGLQLSNLMSDADLIDKTVVVNVVYKFNQELATNNGMDFVKSVDDKCWYTFETQNGDTPYLAHYTNAWGLQSMAGRDTRYTNDYLWTPVGDVYGFKLYNRYMLKNSEGAAKVMTMSDISEGQSLLLAEPGEDGYPAGNEVFELITGDAEGYFRVHPVVNNSDSQYYVRRDPTDDYAKLSTTPCDWTFGLNRSLMAPYYERAGYVGGLTSEGKTLYDNAETIMDVQKVVYDDKNIIHFTSGYYRLHNQPGVSGISTVRYASGYLHDTEKTALSGGIPMHFYSRKGGASTFGESGLKNGYTVTGATRGEIPIPPTENDPSTIFYLNGSADVNNNTISSANMSTQGLNVNGNKMTEGTGTTFNLIDIGGAVFLIVDELTPATRRYLNFDQSYEESSVKMIYDLKFGHEVPTDDAKWCLQPVQKEAEAGDNEMPLVTNTNNGGDSYYYTTFFAPYDVLLPDDTDDKTYNAYVCKEWSEQGLSPVKVPAREQYSIGKFVPAGTPVIIRTNDESGSVTLTIPTTSPSPKTDTCVFTGSYLEQLLSTAASNDVYTLGLPFISEVEKNNDYASTGNITAPLPEQATTGVGFYINASPNKEYSPLQSMWLRNNCYVLHNKIYYRSSEDGLARKRNGAPQYVPVIFDSKEEQEEEIGQGKQQHFGDGRAYDMQGRCVATSKQVTDGNWSRQLAPGMYIVNGKKIMVGK